MNISALSAKARQLRQSATPGEIHLWSALRARQLDGIKFRRQHVFHKLEYIADFYAPERRLVVELDGKHFHNEGRDEQRDKLMRLWGLTILRFPATETTESVVTAIRDFCRGQQLTETGRLVRTLAQTLDRTPDWYRARRAALQQQKVELNKKPALSHSVTSEERKRA